MKLSVKIFFKDLLAVLLLGSIAVFFGYLFYQNLNRSLAEYEGNSLGIVKDSLNTPQRKYSGRTRWADLEQGSLIYENDTVKTFSADRITIELNDGTELILEPNSMIRLEIDSIAFEEGTLSAINREGTSELSIETDSGLLSLNQGVLNLSEDLEGSLTMTVAEGRASITGDDGNAESLNPNQAIQFEKGGTINKIQFSLIPLEPQEQAVFVSYENPRAINFSWEEPDGTTERNITVSTNPAMENPLIHRDLTNNSTDLTLGEGTYYWQISSGDNVSQIRKFSLIHEISPILELPVPEQVFKYRADLPRIPFQWSATRTADYYQLQVSRDPDFSAIIQEKQVFETFFFIEDLEEGNYWWRIRPHLPYSGGLYLPESLSSSFTVEKNLQLEETRLIYPATESLFTPVNTSDGLRFSWKADRDGSSFTWVLSQNSDLSDPLMVEDLTDSFFYAELRDKGNYYWQVRGRTFDGLSLPDSSIFSFQIESLEGTLNLLSPASDALLQKLPSQVQRFSWDSEKQGFFRFQLWHTAPGSTNEEAVADSLTQINSALNILPDKGTYRWKVTLVNEEGDVLDESDFKYFSVEPPFNGPKIISPAPDADLSLIGHEAELFLKWEAQEEAERFNLQIRNLSNNQIIYSINDLRQKEQLIDDLSAFNQGSYQLEITALRDNPPRGYPSESTVSRSIFNIETLKIYQPAQLQSPTRNQGITSLDVLRYGVTFRWTQRPQLNSYIVKLYGSEDHPVPIETFRTDRNFYKIQDLQPGVYWWEIDSEDRGGYKAPSSERRSFVIDELITLERPEQILPAPGSVVDMTTLNELVLKWSSSDYAESYRISLYNNNGDLVFQNSQVTGTEWIIKDLTLLDIGQFFLEIEAVVIYEDINLTLQSLPYRGNFTIELNQDLQVPEILTSDVQYTE